MLAQFQHGCAGADEEIWFGFVFFQADRFAEGDAAEDGDGEDFAFGEDAVEVFHPHGDELHIRPLFGEVEKAGLEGLRLGSVLAATFGKEDEGVAVSHGIDHFDQRIRLWRGFFALDENGIEHMAGKEGTHAAHRPVVFGADHARDGADGCW